MSDPNWDEFEIEDEVITDEDVKDIESSGMVPVGMYLCRCSSSTPKMINFSAYSTMGTKLGFNITEVLEIKKRVPTGEEKSSLVGKKIFDDVAFSNPKEKPGMAKRRKTVALKLGISVPGEIIRKSKWKDDVIDKMVILRVVDGSYQNKDGATVEKTEVGFFNGYESAGDRNNVVESESEFVDEDI